MNMGFLNDVIIIRKNLGHLRLCKYSLLDLGFLQYFFSILIPYFIFGVSL